MTRPASPRLGRGLAALLGDGDPQPATPTSSGPNMLATHHLEPGPFQPRRATRPEALADLVASIEARGVLQPLLARPHPVRPGTYQIIAGERRWRAAQQAGLHEVPVLVRPLSDTDAMTAALVENLQREDLNPIEEAEGFRRLIQEFDLTQEAVGACVGKSRSHIANALRLLTLPENVRRDVEEGRLSAGHARALLAHPEPETLARTVVARGLSVRQTEALAASAEKPGSKSAAPAKDPETEALERDLTAKLGLKVTITFNGKGGTVSIAYGSLDQLDGVITLLSHAA